MCCNSFFLHTWKQSVCFSPQKQPCGCWAQKKGHMVLVDLVSVFRMHACFWNREQRKQRPTGILAIIIPPPCSCHLDWVHIVHRNKWLWLTGCIQSHCRKMFSESAHLSQPTAPLPPGHELRGCFKVKITTQVNKDFKNRKARKRFEYCSQTACYSSTVTQH